MSLEFYRGAYNGAGRASKTKLGECGDCEEENGYIEISTNEKLGTLTAYPLFIEFSRATVHGVRDHMHSFSGLLKQICSL
jgi:hypothetical protein